MAHSGARKLPLRHPAEIPMFILMVILNVVILALLIDFLATTALIPPALRGTNWEATWRAVSAAIILVATGAAISANNLLFLIVAAMMATLLISGLVSRLCLAELHLDFVVPELEPAIHRALDAGAVIEGDIETHSWGRIAHLADPFGHGICFIQFLGRGYDEIADATQSGA